MTIAEDFKKWMGEKASQAADYAGDYPGRVEEQFRSGLGSMQEARQAGLPGHLGALQARYSLTTPFVMDALSQAGKGLSKLGQQQQLGIDEAMSRIGVDVPERKEAEPMGAGIPAVLWGILRGRPLSAAKRKTVKFEPKRIGERYAGTPPRVRTKQDIQTVRNRMMDDIAQYATEEDFMWYRHIGKWIGDTVPNPENREIITRAVAW